MKEQCILTIDQGTTSSRAILFDSCGTPLKTAQEEFTQIFPQDGWVEHDANEIWETTKKVVDSVATDEVACIGITNQRETTVVWDRSNGKPIYNAIVWQDRRTTLRCEQLNGRGGMKPHTKMVKKLTGLEIDPYFSATKVQWILDNVDGAGDRADNGELAFGTIDSWLLWNLTNGKVHATDATNASRTMLYDINKLEWSDELLELFEVPRSMLPEVKENSADFGTTLLKGRKVPITAMVGDQQSASIGHRCFEKGMVKSTYGTGGFMLMNMGDEIVDSDNLLTTINYVIDGKPTYALEGSIFIAGAVMQWLRDGLKIIEKASDSEELAKKADPTQKVYLVPAFVGLGAPHWDPQARGAIFGLTRNTTSAEICRAALESVCYQTKDLMDVMEKDSGTKITQIRVDGGMTDNTLMVQFLCDLLGIWVHKPDLTEITALGATYLAGMKQGIFGSLDEIAEYQVSSWKHAPIKSRQFVEKKYEGWCDAISRIKT
jgi:glycerol kinase